MGIDSYYWPLVPIDTALNEANSFETNTFNEGLRSFFEIWRPTGFAPHSADQRDFWHFCTADFGTSALHTVAGTKLGKQITSTATTESELHVAESHLHASHQHLRKLLSFVKYCNADKNKEDE